mmetsp:Transcript_8587/g.34986  ORF Transcript_8587/g.34986 Transcript_8587/m.34986 type:complete len:433 (+) Transcript_8587:2477-3775(+)
MVTRAPLVATGVRLDSALGEATLAEASKRQPIPLSADVSIGSPTVFPATSASAWQPPSTTPASSEHEAATSFSSTPTLPPLTGETPASTRWSVVMVPVLSKRHASTRPPYGMRKGSVQKICAFISVMSAVLTAMAVWSGSSGGTTRVTISTQRSTSSYCERFPALRPSRMTLAAATSAKRSSSASSASVSLVSLCTFSELYSIMRMRRPWLDRKPVRSATQRQPPFGARTPPREAAPLVARACMSVVPLKSTCALCAPSTESASLAAAPSDGAASFTSGVDSPVSDASLTTAEPLMMRASHGIVGSAAGFLAPVPSAALPPAGSPPPQLNSKTSPGSSASVLSSTQLPSRYTLTVSLLLLMPRSVLRFFCLPKTVLASKLRMENMLKSAYLGYSSSSHRLAQKIWKTGTGPMICSLYSSTKEGVGMLRLLSP